MAPQKTVANKRDGAEEQNLITFRLGEQTYGLPIQPVERIIPMVTITPIPKLNSAVMGIINVRGSAVPVVNLRRHLGMPDIPLQQHTPILLVWVDGLLVGLVVDTVIDMLHLAPEEIARPAEIMPQGLEMPPILDGLTHTDGGAVLILHVEDLFRPDQRQALTEAVESIEERLKEREKEEQGTAEEGEGSSEEEPDGDGEESPEEEEDL